MQLVEDKQATLDIAILDNTYYNYDMIKDISVVGLGKLGLCFAMTLKKRGFK